MKNKKKIIKEFISGFALKQLAMDWAKRLNIVLYSIASDVV